MKIYMFNIVIIMSLFLFGHCSSTKHNRTKRMNSGINTFLGEFKYVVAIVADDAIIATGVIVDRYHIITMAHVFINHVTDEFMNLKYIVIAGTNDVSLAEPPRIIKEVDRVYIPEHFHIWTKPNYGDIAVVKLVTPLDLSETNRLRAATFPPVDYSSMDNNEYKNQLATVAGFGYSMKDSIILQGNTKMTKLHMKIMDYYECNELKQDPSAHFLCARVFNRYDFFTTGVSFGDSGGPLVDENERVIALVKGPLSYIAPIDQTIVPEVFLKVRPYDSFIRDAVAGGNRNMRIFINIEFNNQD